MARHTILIKDYSKVFEEYNAVAAITPGMLLEVTSASKVQAHSKAGQNALIMVATEDELQGKTIDDDYVADYPVQCWIPSRGDMVNMLLADGESVVIGDMLESKGDGTLRKAIDQTETTGSDTFYSNKIIGQALEAVDLTASANTDSARIEVRIA
jgi:hypothetical protein